MFGFSIYVIRSPIICSALPLGSLNAKIIIVRTVVPRLHILHPLWHVDGLGPTFRCPLILLLCQRLLRGVSRRSTPQFGFVVDPDDGYDRYYLSPKRIHAASLTFLPLAACQLMKTDLGEFRARHGFSNFRVFVSLCPRWPPVSCLGDPQA